MYEKSKFLAEFPLSYYKNIYYESGCDEAGRGCLAGPVFAAAVILDPERPILGLKDSKLLKIKEREMLRSIIEGQALAWAVVQIDPATIDQINILQASLRAMKEAVQKLSAEPVLVLVDGSIQIPDLGIPQLAVVKGDQKFQTIAAASILAKTHRDEFMLEIHREFPQYGWDQNKGYPTIKHREAIVEHGLCRYHRKSFSFHIHKELYKNEITS